MPDQALIEQLRAGDGRILIARGRPAAFSDDDLEISAANFGQRYVQGVEHRIENRFSYV